MKSTTRNAQIQRLRIARTVLGCGHIYQPEYARRMAEIAYGRAIHDDTWDYWLDCALAHEDLEDLGGFSEATYCLLILQGQLRRGNKKGRATSQVSALRLATAAERFIRKGTEIPDELPAQLSYHQLKEYAEIQALRPYEDRQHRRKGLKARKHFYTRSEALLILARYPDHRIQITFPLSAKAA